MEKLLKLLLDGTAEVQPDGTMRVLGVLALGPEVLVPPLAPVNLRVTAQSASSASLAWDSGGGGVATNHEVYRNDAFLSNNVDTSFDDTSVIPGVYRYKVLAENADGESAFSSEITVTIIATPEVPGQVELLLTERKSDSITFDWSAVPLAIDYKLYEDAVLLNTVTSGPFQHTGLAEDTEYTYTAIARNAVGDGALSAPLVVSTLVDEDPVWDAVPSQADDVGDAVNLLLTPFCNDPEGTPLTFTALSLPPGLAMSPDGLSVVGTLTTEGTYSAQVRASDGLNTADTTFAWVVFAVADTTPPSIPQNPSGVVNGANVTLTFDHSTDAQSGVRRYVIRRGGAFYSYADGSPFEDLGVPNGSYLYNVRAEDNAGNLSGISNPVNVTVNVSVVNPDTPVFSATPLSTTSIRLALAAGASGPAPTDYDVDFSTVSGSGPWTALPITGVPAVFDHTSLSQTQYWYRAKANTASGTSGYATASASPIGGTQDAHFVIGGTTKTFNCNSEEDVEGVTRRVRPGDIVQINARTGTQTGTLLNIQNPQGTTAQPIVFRPPVGTVVVFKRTAATGSFVVQLSGSTTDAGLHGHVVFDGTTAAGTAEPITGRKYGFRFEPANASDDPTAWIKTKGWVKDVRIKRVHWKVNNGAKNGGPAFSPDDNAIDRTNFPGKFRGPVLMEDCLAEGTGSFTYAGSNYSNPDHGPGMPIEDVTVRGCYMIDTGGTAVIIKNAWEGWVEVDHNIIINSGTTPAATTVQRRSIAFMGSVGEVHHNWVENTSNKVSGGAQSPNHAITCSTNDGPDINGDPGYNGGNPYPYFRARIYSNIVFRGSEIGISVSTGPGTPKVLAEVFSNTVDDFADYGIQIQSSAHDDSFGRNNIVTRTRGVNGSKVPSGSNHVSGTLPYVNVYGVGSYASATAAQKNYRLASVVAVTGGSQLNVDVATTDFLSVYTGAIPLPEDDRIRTTVAGADMGAFEKV